MKKIAALLITAVMALSFTSCSAQEQSRSLKEFGTEYFSVLREMLFGESEPEQDEKTEEPTETTEAAVSTTITAAASTTSTRITTTARTTTAARTTTTARRVTTSANRLRTTSTATRSATVKIALTTTAPVQDKLRYNLQLVPSNGRTMEDAVFYSTSEGKLFSPYFENYWYFFHFSDFGITGVGKHGEELHSSGYSRIAAQIVDNRKLMVQFSSLSSDIKCNNITITGNSNGSETLEYDFDRRSSRLTADLFDASFRNGFYEIKAEYSSSDGISKSCRIYLLVNCASNDTDDYAFYICYGEKHNKDDDFAPVSRRDMISSLLENDGVTPKNALDPDVIYPSLAARNNCDTGYWIEKSHDILSGYENVYKSEKAFLLHEWMTENMKYDYYKVNVLRLSRYYHDGIVDPSLYLSRNNTGVCLDFSSIYAIMCRENGIPCVVLTNKTHAWNAVYLNEEWIEIDLTEDVNRFVYGADLSEVTGTMLNCYSGFADPNGNGCIPDSATDFCW